MKANEVLRSVRVDIPVPKDLPKGDHKIMLPPETTREIDKDLEEVGAMFPLRFVDRVCIEKSPNLSRARVILDEVKKDLESEIRSLVDAEYEQLQGLSKKEFYAYLKGMFDKVDKKLAYSIYNEIF